MFILLLHPCFFYHTRNSWSCAIHFLLKTGLKHVVTMKCRHSIKYLPSPSSELYIWNQVVWHINGKRTQYNIFTLCIQPLLKDLNKDLNVAWRMSFTKSSLLKYQKLLGISLYTRLVLIVFRTNRIRTVNSSSFISFLFYLQN